ncbi:hypothetical protein RA210_U20313 [Rubrivivax sp. A210]|uniref:hypothetical protein n=1 Tax=Rubrivivax sp. A210 TaxID=2772301 RepID=UPI0019197BD9|nr:hypothetical protein [Rubrivivax sp. A210]CAD5372330.1 hypothetical protein RA210_U20313 [Rubrivivax sp. A210]
MAMMLAGCATAPPTQAQIDARRQADFDRSLDKWHGADVRELNAKLGAPNTRTRAANNTSIHEYVRTGQLRGPVGMVTFKCVVRYTVDDRSARVIGHRIEGC